MKVRININKYLLSGFAAVMIFFFQGFNNVSYQKIEDGLLQQLEAAGDNDEFLVWVNFTDKGPGAEMLLNTPELFLTKRSIQRRIKVRGENNIADYTDLPIYIPYANRVKSEGVQVKQRSKWYNSITCYATKSQLRNISQKDFVKRIERVAAFTTANTYNKNLLLPAEENNSVTQDKITSADDLNYGTSLNQNQVINVPYAHAKKYYGQGVMIALFDAGVDNISHPCFDTIRHRGLHTYDFVSGDTNIANEPGQPGLGYHGTITLSLTAGYDDGHLVSPAFGSQYIIAKTENTESETHIEEDNWIAAAEWADSLGADIISSSLGYLEFADTPSYSWTWMNGDSCKLTKAADFTVSKGILVVTSSGNNGLNSQHNTLDTPADGDSVLTVGSINFDGTRSGFSSVGPTIDGRIKPDVMAVGNKNIIAQFGNGTGYINNQGGTSLAVPMVAGVCAMVLSANSQLTPMEIINIVRKTASRVSTPDNQYGYGVINAWASIQEALKIYNYNNPKDFQLLQNFPNPFNPATTISFKISRPSAVKITVCDIMGREIREVSNSFYQPGTYSVPFNASSLSSGVYYYTLEINKEIFEARKMALIK